MENILINVGYDDITKPNLYDYNIEPEWNMISKTNITTLIGNKLDNFKTNDVQYYYNNNVNFIYPIILFDEKIFENFTTIEFSDHLIKCIHNKKCRIAFVYILEGYFANNGVEWINNLLKKYKLDKEDILLITSNLKDNNGNNFTIIKYNYFGNHFQFLEFSKLDKLKVKIFNNSYDKFLNHRNRLHFLCFNGIPRLNRVLMFNELNNNEKLIGKSITTLRGKDKNYYFDIVNWENQTLSSGAHLNVKAHLDCFVNIVTETLFDTQSVFLTEKTYKPIYLCQPFIIFGNPHSLKKLKELGYKTFDKWWDESYDNEIDVNVRFQKIVILLEKIAEWDMDKCFEIKKEMKEILIHNYKRMFDTTEITELLLELKCENKPKNKQNLI
jgi:hypothetical protein